LILKEEIPAMDFEKFGEGLLDCMIEAYGKVDGIGKYDPEEIDLVRNGEVLCRIYDFFYPYFNNLKDEIMDWAKESITNS
jgi:hypothetical protein